MAVDPILGTTEHEQNQAQGHILANDRFVIAAAAGSLRIEGEQNSPPGSPADGATYIVGATPAGDWATFDAEDLAVFVNGGWVAVPPRAGMWGERRDLDGAWCGYSAEEAAWVFGEGTWDTTERRIRGRFPGDVDRFAQAFEFTGLANAGTAQVAHGITNPTLDEYNLLEGSAYDGARSIALPWTDGTNVLQLRADGTNIEIVSNFDATSYNARVRWIYSKD